MFFSFQAGRKRKTPDASLDQVRHHLDGGQLVRVLSKFTPDLPGYHLYYPHRRHASSAFTLLVETLRLRA